MLATEIIRTKRDGGELSDKDIADFLASYTRGDLPDYQMAALAMAIFFKGMSSRELAAWTQAMLHSGEVLNLSDIPGRKVDKHSTGGVGDKISLPLAPLTAACGLKVPMITGRGLGHTGGTLDKLESIPGFNQRLDAATFKRIVRDVGCCLIGQTASIAPADRKLYALRDVTSTVESIPLISSSILSKKLAEGINGLVLDVKFGSGAFMQDPEKAKLLAQTMVGIGNSCGCDTVAYLTSMDQVLGRAVGNSLEVIESVQTLKGKGPADVVELTLVLGAEMLVLGNLASGIPVARKMLLDAIDSGAGFRTFERMVEAQGGDASVLSDFSKLPQSKQRVEVKAERSGFIGSMQTDDVGRAAMVLGAGRRTMDDVIDLAVGLTLEKRLGDPIRTGETLAVLHVNDAANLEAAKAKLLGAITIVDAPTPVGPLVRERIAG